MRKFLIFLLLGCVSAYAQDSRETIMASWDLLSGAYRAYPDTATVCTPAPSGYKPFYVTQLARHGSRRMTRRDNYEALLRPMQNGVLTERGEQAFAKVKALSDEAVGKEGLLFPRGEQEHRELIARLCNNYPQIWNRCRVQAWSTVVPRVIRSMECGMSVLQDKGLDVSMAHSDYIQKTIFCDEHLWEARGKWDRYFSDFSTCADTASFIPVLFRTFPEGESESEFMRNFWLLASDARLVDIDLFEYLTPEQAFPMWSQFSYFFYCAMGPRDPELVRKTEYDASFTLAKMLEGADSTIACKGRSARFFYAHDTNVMPMTHLMGLQGFSRVETDMSKAHEVWCDYKMSPMCGNIQLVFFRRKNDVLVKVLYNETETSFEDLTTDCPPFYHWPDVREYLMRRINNVR